MWSDPLPTEEELDDYYAGDTGWEKRSKSPDVPEHAAVIAKRVEGKRKRYSRELDLLHPNLTPPVAESEVPCVLDFGCGIGGWLEAFDERGWKTVGLEPGPKAAKIAAQRHEIIDDVPKDPTFDLVILSQVVEHLANPLPVLRSIARATRPGGQIFITVPDLGRLPEHKSFSYVKGDVHVFSYTISGMTSLLALAGYRVVGHFDSQEWDRLYPGENARLKVLGKLDGSVDFPVVDEPLRTAIRALRRFGDGLVADGPIKGKFPRAPKTPKPAKSPKKQKSSTGIRS